jgi:hypothetical protein
MWIDLRDFDEKEIRNTVVGGGDYSVRQETKAEASRRPILAARIQFQNLDVVGRESGDALFTHSLTHSTVLCTQRVRWYGNSARLS